MKILKANDYRIYVGAPAAGKKFKVILSDLIKKEFQEPYDESNIKKVLDFSLGFYAKEFETICRNVTSFQFYKFMYWLHEQSCELHKDKEAKQKLP